jgi:serine/threonine protein phosphatase PrpC
MVTNDEIAAVLEAEPVPRDAATRLVAMANDAGARDNVTVVVARFDAAATHPAASV